MMRHHQEPSQKQKQQGHLYSSSYQDVRVSPGTPPPPSNRSRQQQQHHTTQMPTAVTPEIAQAAARFPTCSELKNAVYRAHIYACTEAAVALHLMSANAAIFREAASRGDQSYALYVPMDLHMYPTYDRARVLQFLCTEVEQLGFTVALDPNEWYGVLVSWGGGRHHL